MVHHPTLAQSVAYTEGRQWTFLGQLLPPARHIGHVCPSKRAVQVVHHPTVIAAYAEGRRWTFQGDVDLKSKFWGRSIELMPQGALLLDFFDGDQYVWHKVRCWLARLPDVVCALKPEGNLLLWHDGKGDCAQRQARHRRDMCA